MFIKFVIVIFIAGILFCLADAAILLVKKQRSKDSMVKALTWRIGLSVFLFLILLVGFGLGWITPHAI